MYKRRRKDLVPFYNISTLVTCPHPVITYAVMAIMFSLETYEVYLSVEPG